MDIRELIKLWREFEKETHNSRLMSMTNLETGKPEVHLTHAWFDEFIDWLEERDKDGHE